MAYNKMVLVATCKKTNNNLSHGQCCENVVVVALFTF